MGALTTTYPTVTRAATARCCPVCKCETHYGLFVIEGWRARCWRCADTLVAALNEAEREYQYDDQPSDFRQNMEL